MTAGWLRADRMPPTPTRPYTIHQMDAFDWLREAKRNSIHAVVTDPPFGVLEYTPDQLAKRRNGHGGVWRIPPNFDGAMRKPVPRFTALTESDREKIRLFFLDFAGLLYHVVVPGAHVFVAATPVVSHLVYEPFIGAGFEKRGEIVRIVKTLRGGDRPKNAEKEYPGVNVMPRSSWEPWDCFEGHLRVVCKTICGDGVPVAFGEYPIVARSRDVIECAPARGLEREIADHPSLKPQALMRQLVHASLPLGEGIVLDPFMGSGATIAAATALGIRSVGIEIDADFFRLAEAAIPKLAGLPDAPR